MAVQLFVAGKLCLVVADESGNDIADERSDRLLTAGARVVRRRPEAVSRADLAGASLVLVCDTTPASLAVAAAARQSPASDEPPRLVYVHDRPGLSDFAMPALVRRGDLQIAISTSGKSPGLAGQLRKVLADAFSPRWAQLLTWLGNERARLGAEAPHLRAESMHKYIEALELTVDVAVKWPAEVPSSPADPADQADLPKAKTTVD